MTKKVDWARVWAAMQDELFPAMRMDPSERAIYGYLVRVTRLERRGTVCISKSRLGRAAGVCSATVRFRLRSLEKKRCVRIRGRNLEGHTIEVFLPEEILRAGRGGAPHVATRDYRDPAVREAVLRREEGRCFYCLRELGQNAAVDHVVAVSKGGDDSIGNLVAACSDCNVTKGNRDAGEFLRELYRRNRLTAAELDERMRKLKKAGGRF